MINASGYLQIWEGGQQPPSINDVKINQAVRSVDDLLSYGITNIPANSEVFISVLVEAKQIPSHLQTLNTYEIDDDKVISMLVEYNSILVKRDSQIGTILQYIMSKRNIPSSAETIKALRSLSVLVPLAEEVISNARLIELAKDAVELIDIKKPASIFEKLALRFSQPVRRRFEIIKENLAQYDDF